MSYKRLLKSVHEKLMVLFDETTIYPRYGPITTIDDERRGNPYIQDYYL